MKREVDKYSMSQARWLAGSRLLTSALIPQSLSPARTSASKQHRN
jgi:hypothetical protein